MPCLFEFMFRKIYIKKTKTNYSYVTCVKLSSTGQLMVLSATVCDRHSESAAVPALYPTNNQLLYQMPSLYADRTHKIFGKAVGRDCMPKKYLYPYTISTWDIGL